MKHKRLDALKQQADIQQLCQVTCLPAAARAQLAAAVSQQAQELQPYWLSALKGIPQTPRFCCWGSTTVPAILLQLLTVGAGFICDAGAAEEAETFFTLEAVSARALAG